MTPHAVWDGLDPQAEARLTFLRGVPGRSAVLLLGAFDPPTSAHVALARAAARHTGWPAAFCLTKVVLDRPADVLLDPVSRLELLDALALGEGMGLAVSNRGTYLDVARAARLADLEVAFVVGSDKIGQLTDERFYADGQRGVDATFREARFIVVPRGTEVARRDVEILDNKAVFERPEVEMSSASEVRRRLADGRPIDDLVPRIVADSLRRYTERAESSRRVDG